MPTDVRRLTRSLAVSLAAAVLGAGALYSVVRPVTYESRSSLSVVVSAGASRAGTGEAYAELLRSTDTRSQAGSPPIDLSVRVGARGRVVELRATARSKSVPQPALTALVTVGRRRQEDVGDRVELRTLQSPTAPKLLGASTPEMLGATVLLAALAPLLVLTATRRPSPRRDRRPLRHEARPRVATTPLERRAWRYPTRL
jgi:hypothetical protein